MGELIAVCVFNFICAYIIILRNRRDEDGINEKKEEVTEEIEVTVRCFKCGKGVSVNNKECPFCGAKFESIMPITEEKLPEKMIKNSSENPSLKQDDDDIFRKNVKTKKYDGQRTNRLALLICAGGLLFALLIVILCVRYGGC